MYIAKAPRHHRVQRGFTLIELILVIVLVGILAAVSVTFILPPFQAAADLERRAALVDAADLALNRMTRELRGALPNSVRVHGPGHVEFITTVTAGRYRRLPDDGGGGEVFNPAQSSGEFDVLGGLTASINATNGSCGTGGSHCLSIFNTGQSQPYDAYQGGNIATIVDVVGDTIHYDNGSFVAHSPAQRFHVIDAVVSYICSNGELRRYSGYGLAPTPPPLSGGALVASNVASCQFNYDPGTSTRRGLVTLRLDLEKQDERIFLLAQAQVLNSP